MAIVQHNQMNLAHAELKETSTLDLEYDVLTDIAWEVYIHNGVNELKWN